MAMYDKKSWASFYTFEEHLRSLRKPYLSLKLIEGLRLNKLLDADELQPYVQIQQSESLFESQPGAAKQRGHYEWNELFEVEITTADPLFLVLLDQDDYSQDPVLAALRFELPAIETFKGLQDVWLKLTMPRESISNVQGPEELAVPVTQQVLGSAEDRCPLLHLQLNFLDQETLNRISVQFRSHKTNVNGSDSYTQYHVRVNRNDGVSWSVTVRYSRLYELRKELIQILPSLQSVPFPSKTYFSFLSFLCVRCSKFDEDLIERRKRGLELFLNEVLNNLAHIQSESLNELLKLHFV